MKVRISERQIKEIIACVEERGKGRQKTPGNRFNDVDFAMGATAVLCALELDNHVPVKWMLNPMCNQPIFENENEKRRRSNR